VATRKRAAKKPVKKVYRKKRTVKTMPTKLDYWAITTKEIYETCRRNGMSEEMALAFAMDRSSWPDWAIDPTDPIRKIGWEDGEEDI
jgi:hypothetical protein